MGIHSPDFVVTETVTEEVVPFGAKRPSRIQRFVRGQVVSPDQIKAYKDRTGEDVPTVPTPSNINARLGMIVALDPEDDVAPPVTEAFVSTGATQGPGVTSDSLAPSPEPEPEPEVEPADDEEDAS